MINKLKKIFFPKEEITNSSELSNQYLINKIEKAFREVMERDSFDDRLLFDCDYLVILPPEVYNRIEVNSKIIIEGIIKRFYKVIEQEKEGKQYIPLAKEWCIQFIPRDFESGKKDETQEPMTVISNPVPIKWQEAKQEELQKVSINGKHSSYSNWDLNDLILSNVNMLEKGKGFVKFNPNLVIDGDYVPNQEGNQNKSQSTGNHGQIETTERGLAKIGFFEGGGRLSFTMKQELLVVGKGQKGELSKPGYLPIETTDRGLRQNHFHIKYVPAERGFYLATFAPIRVNEEALSISQSTDNPIWHPLTAKSAIICGLTQFDFEVL